MDKETYTNKPSFIILPLLVALLLAYSCFGQTYPTQEPNTATYGSYVVPESGLPNYLQWQDAELSDSRVMRITDRQIFNVDGQRLRHNYSLDQTFNSDGTLIKMAGYPAAIIDAETYEFLYWSSIPSYGRWSNTQPNIIYGTPSNQFVSHDVNTNQSTVLHTFQDYDSIDFGFGKGNQDNNDKYVVLIGENGNETTLILYDIQLDFIVNTLQTNDIRWATISQLGNYIVVGRNAQGTGNGTGGEQIGIYSYDLNFSNQQVVYSNGTPHGDVGIDANGNEVYVGYGNSPQWNNQHSLFMSRLDGGGVTDLFPYVNGLGIWGGHISCRNIERSGWAYVSEQCCYTNPVATAEIFAIKLDNSGIVERYGKHNGKPSTYLHQAQAVPNRNGTKIVFASNWFDGFESTQFSAHSFVLEVNQETLSNNQYDMIIEKPFKTLYFNYLGQQLDNLDNASDGIYIVKQYFKNRIHYKKIILKK